MERGKRVAILLFVCLLIVSYVISPDYTADFLFAIVAGITAFVVKRETGLDYDKAFYVFAVLSYLIPFWVLLLYYQYIMKIPSSEIATNLVNYGTSFLITQYPILLIGVIGGIIATSFIETVRRV
jgi:hypothetical protein